MCQLMPMTLLKRGPTPYYHQIESILRGKITSGELPEGSRLPPEDDLASSYRVSRATVRQALQNLERDGLVRREQGRGTFVSAPTRNVAQLKMTCLLEDLIALGIPAKTLVLESGYLPAPRTIAEALRLRPGAEIFSFLRVVQVKNAAFSATRIYLPAWIGTKLRKDDLTAQHLLRTLARRCSVQAEEAEQCLEAITADADQARLLGVAAGSALLSVTRTSSARSGQPVERSTTLYRSDRVRFLVSQKQRSTSTNDWVLQRRGARSTHSVRSVLPA